MPQLIKDVPVKVPPQFRAGQNVKFELDENLQFVCLGGDNRVYLAAPEDPHEVESLKLKMAKSKDGRFVGIFYPAGRMRYFVSETKTVDGKEVTESVEKFCPTPARVVPYRSVLVGDAGDHHPTHAVDGRVINVAFTVDCLRNLGPVLLQEDLPGYRRQTCDENWNPRA